MFLVLCPGFPIVATSGLNGTKATLYIFVAIVVLWMDHMVQMVVFVVYVRSYSDYIWSFEPCYCFNGMIMLLFYVNGFPIIAKSGLNVMKVTLYDASSFCGWIICFK